MIVQEGDERYIVKTFADGEVVRDLIVKTKPARRRRSAPYQKVSLDRTRKKRF